MLAEIRNSGAALIQNLWIPKQEKFSTKSYRICCSATPVTVQVLNGASQIYPFLRRRFFLARPGAKTLIPAPTFGEYKAAFPLHDAYADNGHFRMEDIAVQAEGAAVIVVRDAEQSHRNDMRPLGNYGFCTEASLTRRFWWTNLFLPSTPVNYAAQAP